MKEYIEIILTVLGFVIVLLIAIIGWIARKYILRLEVVEKRVEQIEQRISVDLGEIKTNYLDRFADIKDVMSVHHEELITGMTSITAGLEKQRQFCYLIQEQKNKPVQTPKKKNGRG